MKLFSDVDFIENDTPCKLIAKTESKDYKYQSMRFESLLQQNERFVSVGNQFN